MARSTIWISSEPMLNMFRMWGETLVASREPDEVITRPGKPDYIRRWYVMRHDPKAGQIGPNVYFHVYGRADAEDPHDHPFDNVSMVLRGSYREAVYPRPTALPLGDPAEPQLIWRVVGDVVAREAKDIHAIREVDPGTLTLFLTGPKIRDWGFHTERGFLQAEDFKKLLAERQGELV